MVCILRLAAREIEWQTWATSMAPRRPHTRISLFFRSWLLALAVFAAVAGFSGEAFSAETTPTREFQVKAAFLYNFVQFVEWPPQAFGAPDTPIIIGVLGQDPFGEFLDQLVSGEVVNGRPLVVQRFRSVGEIQACHVLFVSGSEGKRGQQIIASLGNRSILTVCDWEGLMDQGAMVQFVTERNRVRLRINLDSVKAAGLTISSKLLRSAETITQAR